MSNVKNTSKKNVSATSKKQSVKKDAVKKEAEKSVLKLQLSEATKKALEAIPTKVKKDKDLIYIYPETMTEEEKKNEVGKKWRNRNRSKMQKFANNIFFYFKGENVEALEKEISAFDAFYKQTYRVTDYTLSSISNTKDEKKEKDLKLMLQLISEYKTQTAKK